MQSLDGSSGKDRYHPWPFTQRIHADQIRSSGSEILVVEGNRQVKEGDIARVVGGETASKE